MHAYELPTNHSQIQAIVSYCSIQPKCKTRSWVARVSFGLNIIRAEFVSLWGARLSGRMGISKVKFDHLFPDFFCKETFFCEENIVF